MTHAVPRPRKSSARPSSARHPVTPVRPSSAADRRALVTPDRVPLDRQPPLPKRTPGTALDEVHRNSIFQLNRDEPAPASDRWFRANQEPGDTSSPL